MPVTYTDSAGALIGAPWEIRVSEHPMARDGKRLRSLYTKAGDLLYWHTHLVLHPPLGIGFAVLVAGEAGSAMGLIRARLNAALVDAFIPAV
jgi:hypothetical protein